MHYTSLSSLISLPFINLPYLLFFNFLPQTNVGSLYIAPLAQPTEPQAQRLLLQQQQQQQARDSPIRQLPQQQQQAGGQPLRWLSSQPATKEQAPWARPEENGNVVPSSLRQGAPVAAPIAAPAQQAAQPTTSYYQQQQQPQPQQQQQLTQGNGYTPVASPVASQQNFGSNAQQGGLRLQINLNTNSNNNANQTGPRVRSSEQNMLCITHKCITNRRKWSNTSAASLKSLT